MGYPSSKRPHGEHGGWHDVDDATDPSRRLRPAASAHAPRAGSALGTSRAFCLVAWLAGCYLLALYPAWQVVMFYVFALLGVWVVVDFARGGGRLAVGAAFFALAAALALAAVFALVGLVLYQAKDALLAAIAALRTRPSGLEERRVLCVALICVAWPGLFVNPVQVGTGPLTENDTARAASAIAAEDPDARWLTDASELAQLLVASGIPTVNSTNLYPNLELWGLVDEDGAYVDAYNRYGSVPVSITTEPTSFESGQPDLIEVHLNADDVPKLGVTYLLTSQDLSGVAGERVSFRPLESVDGRTIYEVVSP